jgi:hypothetical protein
MITYPKVEILEGRKAMDCTLEMRQCDGPTLLGLTPHQPLPALSKCDDVSRVQEAPRP